MSRFRGIPDVPLLDVRSIVDRDGRKHDVLADSRQLRNFLVDIREVLVDLRGRLTTAPTPPTNLKVTATALSNIVQFTRSQDGDFYEVLWNSSATLATSQIVGIGDTGQWLDYVGLAAIKRFYWVRARKYSGAKSREVGPQSGTTLAATAGITPPVPPPASGIIVMDQTTGRQIPYVLDRREL